LDDEDREAEPLVATGVGGATCKEFNEQRKSQPKFTENRYFIWAQGFLSGLNAGQLESQKLYFDMARQYCEENPQYHYFMAAMFLGTQMKRVETGQRPMR
jgi:hypothetical protein